MKIDEIIKLVERYDSGDTSEKEEQELFRFFSEENVPSSMQADQDYFIQLKRMRDEQVPQDLEARLSSMIDSWELKEKQFGRLKKTARSVRWQWMSGVAAGLFILFGVGIYLFKNQENNSIREDTCATPEKAYQETQRALLLFSSALNKGLKKMETISQTTEKMQESVNEQLNQIKTVKP